MLNGFIFTVSQYRLTTQQKIPGDEIDIGGTGIQLNPKKFMENKLHSSKKTWKIKLHSSLVSKLSDVKECQCCPLKNGNTNERTVLKTHHNAKKNPQQKKGKPALRTVESLHMLARK
jgi:hypothetical protein